MTTCMTTCMTICMTICMTYLASPPHCQAAHVDVADPLVSEEGPCLQPAVFTRTYKRTQIMN